MPGSTFGRVLIRLFLLSCEIFTLAIQSGQGSACVSTIAQALSRTMRSAGDCGVENVVQLRAIIPAALFQD